MSWFRDLLITPECLGCQRLGVVVCQKCQHDVEAFTIQHQDLQVTCVAEYDKWIRERIIEFKNGKSSLARPLAELLHPHICQNAVLVPVPTTRAKIKTRGFDTVGLLCKELAQLEPRRTVVNGLAMRRQVRDQVGLGFNQRQRNLDHAFRATAPVHQPVVVIDDVITTGATLLEANRALNLAGATAVQAVVLCGSPQKRYG